MNKNDHPDYSRVFGLTGIMGSGKSTVASYLREKGALVILADELSKKATDPSYERYAYVKEAIKEKLEPLSQKRYGQSLFENDRLHRIHTANLVFNDKAALSVLNEILHREVHIQLCQILGNMGSQDIIIYDVPLLFETGLETKVKKTIVVYCPEETAIERAIKRTGLTKEEIQKRLKNQISIEKKRDLADYVIDNSHSLNDLPLQINKLWDWLEKWKRI